MLQRLGRERYVRALTEHRRLLREAFTSHGGTEVEMQGDSFFYAFPFARDAVVAAAAGQRALAEHGWEAEPIRVRMGLHTGEPMQAEGSYAGLDVHRAARVMSAGAGGQVLVSQQTADLVEGELPEGVGLRYLGEHRLKDLLLPQRLYDLVVEGLPDEFAPPATLENRPTNLPVQATPLVGRERELEELTAMLARPDVRLLTLTGPGGTGKTRLALQLAAEVLERFPDGVWFVNLAALSDSTLVLPTVAQTLAVKEEGGRPLAETLAEQLAGKASLLVLDNFEQVADAAELLPALLSRTSKIKLLVTSRVSLHLSAEYEYPVPTLAAQEALIFFTGRARAAKPSFSINGNRSVIVEICRRLDHLPLAIELAAARIKVLPPQALLERLDQRLQLLTGGARDLEARQRTLRATIDWSYQLLPADEQRLFARLAVFAGGRTLHAIEAVCDPDDGVDVFETVATLVDNSLLRQEESEDGEPRYVMLETIQEYAGERLAAGGERDEMRRRHAEHFALLAEEAAGALAGDGDQRRWLARLGVEQHNIRAALESCRDLGDNELLARLAVSLQEYWEIRGLLSEGQSWFAEVLRTKLPPLLRARALHGTGTLAGRQGDYEAQEATARQAADIFRQLDEKRWLGKALLQIGNAVVERGRYDDATALYEEAAALAHELGNRRLESSCISNIAAIACERGEYEVATAMLERTLELDRELNDSYGVMITLINLGTATLGAGSTETARTYLRQGLEQAVQLGAEYMLALAFDLCAKIASARAERERAVRLFAVSQTTLNRLGAEMAAVDKTEAEATLSRLRTELGEQHFQNAWAEGETLDAEEAIRYALE